MIRLFPPFKGLLILIALAIFLFITNKIEAKPIIANDSDDSIQLQTRVAKGYSDKFCNAIGIGVSKDGAAKLAISENLDPKFNPALWLELVLSGKKNLGTIDNNLLAEKVSSNVVRDCGNPIGLSGEKGVNDFKEYFLLIQDEILNSREA